MPATGAGGVSGGERPAKDPALSAEGLGRRIGEAWIWRGISFALAAGESLAVTGPSGSGKTLLLRALAGLDGFEEGRVLVWGEAAEGMAPQRLRARVSYLHQRPALLEGSVLDNLERPFRLTIHRHRNFDRYRALELLSGLGRDEAFLAFPAGELSGGEQQVVALVRALQLDPQVLLLDEPSASLDAETAGAIENLVTGWVRQEDGRACVWTSHDQAQLGRVAARRLALPRGEP